MADHPVGRTHAELGGDLAQGRQPLAVEQVPSHELKNGTLPSG
jgi:hypothetical protein